MRLPAWVNDYVGLPFVDGGRTRAGVDCYGLVRLVLREQFGISLPDYGDVYQSVRERETIAGALTQEKSRWVNIEQPHAAQLGDVALFRVGGLPLHCGLVLSPDVMLHVCQGCETVVEEMHGLVWGARFEGIYCYQCASGVSPC